ncbi:MAG: hypothetical protein JST75_10845 [Bacteroidetes bacterium]|nr:hypothetical protein [Bacteroidota bacterium]
MKPKTLLLFFMLISIFCSTEAQQVEKRWFDKNDSTFGYYTVIKPLTPNIQGAVVLLDGFGGNADGFLRETRIHSVACTNSLLTICFPTGMHLYADKSIIDLMNRALSEIIVEFKLRKDQFAIGGMSVGGTIALRYAELCKEKPAEFPIAPKAVFDVDSPLDLINFCEMSDKDLRQNGDMPWTNEARMVLDKLKNEIGDYKTDIKKYNEVSPFYKDAKEPGNEKFLKDVAFRTYHDVDVNWHIQNRRHSIYNTNMLNGSELVNRLVIMGNHEAEFVSSKIEGRRNNGTRHPHSWNIVDEPELVSWIKEKLHFYPDHLEKPFVYKAPDDWQHETIIFPMDFAPRIPYKGFEELRFVPGWGNPNNVDKWAYTILWWLDDAYHFDEKTLQQNLEDYYTGLTRGRAVAEKLDMNAWTPAKAKVQKIKATTGDRETYDATAYIFDSQVTKKPGVLYFKIHIKDCADQNRTILIIEVSENPYSAAIWQQLDKINGDFRCVKEVE